MRKMSFWNNAPTCMTFGTHLISLSPAAAASAPGPVMSVLSISSDPASFWREKVSRPISWSRIQVCLQKKMFYPFSRLLQRTLLPFSYLLWGQWLWIPTREPLVSNFKALSFCPMDKSRGFHWIKPSNKIYSLFSVSKNVKKTCRTQRVFFPELLPHMKKA